jgi:hypothetical protein
MPGALSYTVLLLYFRNILGSDIGLIRYCSVLFWPSSSDNEESSDIGIAQYRNAKPDNGDCMSDIADMFPNFDVHLRILPRLSMDTSVRTGQRVEDLQGYWERTIVTFADFICEILTLGCF